MTSTETHVYSDSVFWQSPASDLRNLHKDTTRWSRDKDKGPPITVKTDSEKDQTPAIGNVIANTLTLGTSCHLQPQFATSSQQWRTSNFLARFPQAAKLYSFFVFLERMWVFMCVLKGLFMCSCVCMLVMWMCICRHVCRRQKSMSDILNCIPLCFIHTRSHWTWSSLTWLDWLGSE